MSRLNTALEVSRITFDEQRRAQGILDYHCLWPSIEVELKSRVEIYVAMMWSTGRAEANLKIRITHVSEKLSRYYTILKENVILHRLQTSNLQALAGIILTGIQQ